MCETKYNFEVIFKITYIQSLLFLDNRIRPLFVADLVKHRKINLLK